MYDETKKAVKKAFKIGQILFSMGPNKFNKLVEISDRIKLNDFEINMIMEKFNVDYNEAVISWYKKEYSSMATKYGFTKEQGLAMLSYVALIHELEN